MHEHHLLVAHDSICSNLLASFFTGFISTYDTTWLVYCPPDDRTVLYISKAIRSVNVAPAMTTRGAISWLQHEAFSYKDIPVPAYTTDIGADSFGGVQDNNSSKDADDADGNDGDDDDGNDKDYEPSTTQ